VFLKDLAAGVASNPQLQQSLKPDLLWQLQLSQDIKPDQVTRGFVMLTLVDSMLDTVRSK
jgi:hypothetical protein